MSSVVWRDYNRQCMLLCITFPFYILHFFSACELLLIICSLNTYPIPPHFGSKWTWDIKPGPDYKFKCQWPLCQWLRRRISVCLNHPRSDRMGRGKTTPLCVILRWHGDSASTLDVWLSPRVCAWNGERKESPLSRWFFVRGCYWCPPKDVGSCKGFRLEQK